MYILHHLIKYIKLLYTSWDKDIYAVHIYLLTVRYIISYTHKEGPESTTGWYRSTTKSPPEAEVAESPFTVISLSSHLSAHIASNASYLWCTVSGASTHDSTLPLVQGAKITHTRFQLSWQTTVWSILRGLAQLFFNLKTKNYLPYLRWTMRSI